MNSEKRTAQARFYYYVDSYPGIVNWFATVTLDIFRTHQSMTHSWVYEEPITFIVFDRLTKYFCQERNVLSVPQASGQLRSCR